MTDHHAQALTSAQEMEIADLVYKKGISWIDALLEVDPTRTKNTASKTLVTRIKKRFSEKLKKMGEDGITMKMCLEAEGVDRVFLAKRIKEGLDACFPDIVIQKKGQDPEVIEGGPDPDMRLKYVKYATALRGDEPVKVSKLSINSKQVKVIEVRSYIDRGPEPIPGARQIAEAQVIDIKVEEAAKPVRDKADRSLF